jgi:hypothetical protein
MQLNLITDGNAALEGYIVTLTKQIEACNAVTLLRRTRNVKKLFGRKHVVDSIDPMAEAYLVSGSNPTTKDLLHDMHVETELSMHMEGKVPARTVELRRRTLKLEHCLQITLECQTLDSRYEDYESHYHNHESLGGPDADGGYDDFSTPTRLVAAPPSFDWSVSANPNPEKPDWLTMNGPEKLESMSAVESRVETDLSQSPLEATEAEWNYSPHKIFIDNIGPGVTDSDLIHALRLCGKAKSVRFMKTDSGGGILSAPPPMTKDRVPLTADELFEKFGIRTDARPRMCVSGGLRNVLLPKNPLAVITSVKRRAIKKTIAQVFIAYFSASICSVSVLLEIMLRIRLMTTCPSLLTPHP